MRKISTPYSLHASLHRRRNFPFTFFENSHHIMRAPARPTGTCRQKSNGNIKSHICIWSTRLVQSVGTVKAHSSTRKKKHTFPFYCAFDAHQTTQHCECFGLLGVSVYVCVVERIVRRVETGNFVMFVARAKSLGTFNRSPSACASQTHRKTACANTCSATHTHMRTQNMEKSVVQ